MAILSSFIQYVIIMIILAFVAFAGLMVGKTLRNKKDAKEALAGEGQVSEAESSEE